MNNMELAFVLATGLLQVVDRLIAISAIKKQKRELTPEEEAQHDALVAMRYKAPHWQPSMRPEPEPVSAPPSTDS